MVVDDGKRSARLVLAVETQLRLFSVPQHLVPGTQALLPRLVGLVSQDNGTNFCFQSTEHWGRILLE